MALPMVNTKVFFKIIFSAINRRSYSSYKKYGEFSKTMQGRLIVTEGRGYPLVAIEFYCHHEMVINFGCCNFMAIKRVAVVTIWL
jgi:5-methylcytosine-specific restriction endonuclease McrBC regulatory subunit McrC